MSGAQYQKYIIAAAVLVGGFAACKKAAAPQKNTQQTATLKSTAPFPMGSAVNSPGIQNANYLYSATLQREYNSVTPDYELKFNEVEPAQGTYNYAPGDFLVAYAAQYHMRFHAHNLIWNQALPDWVVNFQGDSLAWENLFETHIQSEATHFAGKVASWDVVNEALRDDNGALRDLIDAGDPIGSIWRQHLGPDYIARAFEFAHAADPKALLFYNDYGQEWGGPKLDTIVAMVNRFKQRGIPISGLGMQMHIDINVDTAGISAGLRALASTGLLIHISELDISVNPNSLPNIVFTATLQSQQAALYQFVAESYRANVPAAQRYGITTWEFSDHDTWITSFYNRKDWPLPFDTVYAKKPAYFGLMKGTTD